VHRPVGEQLEDRRTHVTAPTASAAAWSATPAAAGSTGAEASWTEAAGTEAETSAGAEAETGAEAAVLAAVFTYVVAEVATGLPALFVQHAAIGWCESETGVALERAFVEWGVHLLSLFRRETPNALPIR
jgi:hypothetical protein